MQPSFPESTGKIISQFLEDVACPRSLTVAILLRYKEYGELVSLRCSPAQYLTAEDYYRASIATELLRKTRGLPTGIDLAAVAKDAFWESERQCARTNARLSPFLRGGPFEPDSGLIQEVISEIRLVVSSILKRLPDDLSLRFGPGATLEDRGRLTLIPDKMTSQPTGTRASLCLEPFWSSTAWSRALMREFPHRSAIKVVRGNRFTTVPKDSSKDRGIAIEPSFNVAFQLAMGREIRSRLSRVGNDLLHGQNLHRRLAQQSSRDGSLCTIDLSSASDTVCRNLVELLLPSDWYATLNCLRSPTTQIDGKTVFLEKFSSMGNGYTFELETLLFLAIVTVGIRRCGVTPENGTNVSVYGDDIIIPVECSRSVLSLLRYLGFTPNLKKTFCEGPFRESCGGDFFDGWAVRPFYLKEFPREPHEYISFANGIRRLVGNNSPPGFRRDSTHRTWLRLLEAMPTAVRRLRGPEALGDLVIHDDDESRWQIKVRNCIRSIAVWRPVGRRVSLSHWKPGVQLASLLYGCSSMGISPRSSVAGYKQGWTTLDGITDPSQLGWSWYREASQA